MSVDNTADEIAKLLELDPEKVMVEPGLHPRVSLSAGAARRLLVLAKKGRDMREDIDSLVMEHSGWMVKVQLDVPKELGDNVDEATAHALKVLADLGFKAKEPFRF